MNGKIKKPKAYIGIFDNGKFNNKGVIWYECNDGKYRSNNSLVVLTQSYIDSDLSNDFCRETDVDIYIDGTNQY